MALPDNFFDEKVAKKLEKYGVPPTVDQQVDAVMDVLNAEVRNRVREIAEEHRRHYESQDGWCGPSVSQQVRSEIGELLNS